MSVHLHALLLTSSQGDVLEPRSHADYSLCKELLAPNPIAISRCRRRRAVRPIVLLSVSGEERAKDHPNWPRRWRTAALDVLAERSRRSRPSVHGSATRSPSSAPTAQLLCAGQGGHGIECRLLGCCSCTRTSSSCPKIHALRARSSYKPLVAGWSTTCSLGDSGGCGCMCGTPERVELCARALVYDVIVHERLRTARASVCGRRRENFVTAGL